MTRRGQFVTVVLAGDYGKPHPALVVQSDLFALHPSVVVCLLTSDLQSGVQDFRIDVLPTEHNGLRRQSQIAVDKIGAVRADKVGAVIGHADAQLMALVTRAMALFLNIT